ncbi:hypothetical protein B0J11DRAFT_512522 [Dendryphion nanum]|uniref:Uncharacterized protein n=1 Tax=Dendryphion nanum TaxID=256645 RepID=A0A9P9D0C8_9PLEO|nr:hypothetical protein B0J11DRAFT_512522 [Dendryphion nanum]
MRFSSASAITALFCIFPATAHSTEVNNELVARGITVHCKKNTPTISPAAVGRLFRTLAGGRPEEQCGASFGPTLHIGGKSSVSARTGNFQIYVCNSSEKKRCVTLGKDRGKILEDASEQCNGRLFYVREDDGWTFGVDVGENKECGF